MRLSLSSGDIELLRIYAYRTRDFQQTHIYEFQPETFLTLKP